MIISGYKINKNTMVSVSVGAIFTLVFSLWMISGIGRPLFAADLDRIEKKIDDYQKSTTVQILTIRKEALQSDLRSARRDVRKNSEDGDAAEDLKEIEDDIESIDKKIDCYRTKDCEVERTI